MISIYQLTTSDAVRALLGVDEAEVSDEIFVAAAIEDELQLDILDWLPAGETVDEIVSTGLAAEPGTDESIKHLRLSAYAKAFCAHYFVASQENWRLTRLSDGAVTEHRQDKVDLAAMARAFQGLMGRHKEALLALLVPTTTTTAQVALMGVSKPSYDPVTG